MFKRNVCSRKIPVACFRWQYSWLLKMMKTWMDAAHLRPSSKSSTGILPAAYFLNLCIQLPQDAIGLISAMLNPPPAHLAFSDGSNVTKEQNGSGLVVPHQCAHVAQLCQLLCIVLIFLLLLAENLVNHSILESFLTGEPVVTVHIGEHLVVGLAAVACDD